MQKIYPLKRKNAPLTLHQKVFRFCKRSFDILASLVMMVVLFPVCLVIAVVAAIDTKGSPLFIQTRMGRNNRPFRLVKFRTMSTNAPANVASHKLHHAEAYISPIGGALRRLSLDELPQLWNIFLGSMSFVGPRPVVLTEGDLLDLRSKNGANLVRPGLTGWAQVNGRDLVTVADKARLDAFYADNLSLALDCKVLLKTVAYVLRSQDVAEGDSPTVTATGYSKERSA